MHSHKFNQNLLGLTFVVLLVFICQTTAKNDCQRDLTKTGKEMLASAQTLLHGKKTPKTEFKEDPIKTGQELVDTASTLFDGMKSGSFDGEMAMKLVQKYAFGVLCNNIKPNFEMNENLELQNNFCQQLKNGKSMEEAAVKVESSAINLIQNLDKSKILQNIRQKIAENSFLDEKIKEKMAKLLGHFKIEMDKFNAIKIVYNQHENRRRKRAGPGHDHDEEEDDDDDGDDDDDKVKGMEEGKPAGRKAKFGAAIKSEKAKKAGLVLICIIVLVIMLGAFGTLTVTQSGQPLQPFFTGVSIVLLLLLLCTSAFYCCLKD